MAKRRVEVTLGPDGSIKVEGFGSCNGTPEIDLLKKLYDDPKNIDYKEEHFQSVQETTLNGLPSGYCG